MASTPYTVKWGILATGGITQTFAKDLLTNPTLRGVTDVQHTIVAAASSNSAQRAQQFLKDINAPSSTKAYGSYVALVADPDIDIIYVATPHSHHFQNTMLCLLAGKNVLCEKAFTVNAAQARKLVDTAREKNLFLMEAVKTRYFPLSVQIRSLVTSGAIGTIHRVLADLSVADGLENGDTHRAVNMDLAGGALLDLGVYALTWIFQILYHCQTPPREKPTVLAAMNKYAGTGADENTSIILQFPKSRSMGIATASLVVDTDPGKVGAAGAAVRIQGSAGEIQVLNSASKPTHCRIIPRDPKQKIQEVELGIPKDPARDGWGQGMFWEADEAARCLRDGKLESETLSWEESVLIMEVMDDARRQSGLKYPEAIESDIFDAKSPLNGEGEVQREYRGDFGS